MLALAGYPMGLSFTFLEPTPGASAGQVGRQLEGPYDEPRLLRELARDSDLVTFEFESVPEAAAAQLEELVPVFPSPAALAAAQDRLLEKRLFSSLGIPSAEHREVGSKEQLEAAAGEIGYPSRLKSRRLGYDGHGQVHLEGPEQLPLAFSQVGEVPSVLERELQFERELSLIAVRSSSGETAAYPLVENHHREGVLRLTLAPAPGLGPGLQADAEGMARALLDHFGYVGVLALELFQVRGQLLANEIAPRVHNSGHWSIDGAVSSQFENHLRAGLGWPLGSTSARGYSAMLNLLGELPQEGDVAAVPDAHLHLYGKQPRPGRKLGHVTVSGPDPVQVTAQLGALARTLGIPLPEPLAVDSYWPR